ncbi:OsmC family protein [Leeia sp. TBRC 13508]|uniref:OsmC family protein n=1 Tax=Leeia speluncae TaxID=2884804 RepID=A0ABS8D1T5_9NEIS|nr:OsmC family protein [Leeia speluncae]MCB6182149.1 OsmC family protein [Leeia speluncae]
MKARVKWVENRSFLAMSESGHSVLMDGPPDAGGRNLGPRPMEMLLMGAGGCSAFDVVMILEKGRQAVVDCEVEVTAERAVTDPKVFTKIHLQFKVTGKSLKPEVVERAVALSAEKYCSATIMLGKMAEVTHSVEIVDVA